MSGFWTALQTTDVAVWINLSRWGYAAATTTHVLSIAALIGSILVFDLRLVGFARWLDPQHLARLVLPVAGTALCGALLSGALLFMGRAAEYAAYDTFRIKLVLIAGALAMTLMAHLRYGIWLERADDRWRVFIGLASIALWVGTATCGRMIAFIHG